MEGFAEGVLESFRRLSEPNDVSRAIDRVRPTRAAARKRPKVHHPGGRIKPKRMIDVGANLRKADNLPQVVDRPRLPVRAADRTQIGRRAIRPQR